jgi:GNAT superfamily N-acetyltransferase
MLYRMIIRPLTVFEREIVRNFYISLSADDRRRRFCCTLADETISKYVDRLNFTRDTVLGAFDAQAQLIGLAELVRGNKSSEMAFSVRPDRRGQKIGTKLIERLISRASLCGIRKVFVMFLSDNTPMRKMATRAGMPVHTEDGESHAERELPVPSTEDLTRWFVEERLSHGAYFSTLGVARWCSLPEQSAGSAREPAGELAPSL